MMTLTPFDLPLKAGMARPAPKSRQRQPSKPPTPKPVYVGLGPVRRDWPPPMGRQILFLYGESWWEVGQVRDYYIDDTRHFELGNESVTVHKSDRVPWVALPAHDPLGGGK